MYKILPAINLFAYIALLMFAAAPLFSQGGARSFVVSFASHPGLEQSGGWLRLYMTAPRATRGSVDFAGTSLPFVVAAEESLAIDLPVTLATTEGLERLGIIVEADDSLIVIGVNHAVGSSDAFLVMPVEGLDTAYIVPGWPSFEGGGGGFFTVAGVDDRTVVTIRAPRGGGADVVATLGRGETYTVRGNDPTGWSIRASRPVALFAGAITARVPSIAAASRREYSHLVEQILPVSRWDSSALALPHPSPARLPNNRYRIVAAFDSTIIRINGLPRLRLDRGGSFEEDLDGSKKITATGPFLVSQYEMSPEVGGSGDPFMVVIAPTAQLLADYRFIALPTPPFDRHYAIIAAPREDLGSLRLDGLPLPDTVRWVFNGASGFSFTRLAIGPGAHRMTSLSGRAFSLTICGYGDDESYGYPAPMRHQRILERFDRRAPVLLSVRSDGCFAREVVLQDSGEIISGFDIDALPTVALQRVGIASVLYSTDSTRITLRLLVSDRSDSGVADITVVDRSGNRRLIHLLFPQTQFTIDELLDETELVIAVDQGSVRCDPIAISNRRSETVFIVDARLSGNRTFSVPPSSFPLVIPPGTTMPLLLCVDPDAGGAADTLLLSDSCGIVAAYALRLESTLLQATDECGTALTLSRLGRSKRSADVLAIVPNPTGSLGAAIHLRAVDEGMTLQFISATGALALELPMAASDLLQIVEVDPGSLPAGNYIVRLVSADGVAGDMLRMMVVR